MRNTLNFILLAIFTVFFFSCEQEFELSEPDKIISPAISNAKLKSVTINYDWAFQYVDNFDYANVSNDYGLNDNLGNRQLHGPWKNTTWIRKEGTWYDKVIQPWFSQANHPFSPGVLSFHLEHTAVMLNTQISCGSAGRYRVSFKTDPVVNDQSSASWTSFMLEGSSSNRGWVTQTEFGFLIGSNGGVQVFQNGNYKACTGSVTAAEVYDVVLDIMPNSLVATINGSEVTAVLNETLPTSAYAYLGAYIESGTGYVSTVDDLVITTQHQTGESRIKHYGYYWTSAYYGENISQVSDYTNFNFIESITPSVPNTKTHVLQVRWQFWSDPSGALRSDWLAQWNNLLSNINLNIDKIKALYICDEPFWAVNVNLSDYNMVLSQVKSDLPNLPIISVFAYPTVEDLQDTRIANISGNVDWVGADKYVAVNDFSQVVNMNNILMNARPNDDIFLIPQTCFAGTTTDAQVAEINWMFYNEALNNNRVVGIWNFGLWSHQQPSEVPLTLEVQKLIGNAIVNY
tara:strand:- start:8872 stop:10416 length:1545 start_codon:yes stop_codon:yes gene_type:complete